MAEQMKPSGIDWIGDIPKSWKVTRLQTLFDQVKDKNSGTKEKNLLSLSYGKIVKKDIEGAFGLIPESFDTYNIIKKNDIVLRLTDMQNDQVSLRTGLVVNALLGCHNLALSCCHEIARISVMECSFCDGADSRPITKGISSCIHALPAL